MTGSTHANHRSARSPRPTPEGPARDSPIAEPQTGTKRSEPSAPASARVSGRHNEPGSRPASACPAQPPSKAGGASPRDGERHHGVGKADRSNESYRNGRGAAHHAGPPGTPGRHAAGHNQGTRTGAKQQLPPGAANLVSEQNTQRTTAPEQVPGNTKTRTPQTLAWSGRVQAGRAHRHTHTPTPQPGVAGRSQTPSPSKHTHTARPSQEWRGTSGARTQTHTNTNTPAGSGGAQPKPEPEHTHPHRTPQPEVAGYKRSDHTSTPTPTPQPGVAGRSQDPSRSTHTRARNGGVQAERANKHAHPNTPARRGGARPKPKPKHTRSHCTPQPGVAGYKRSVHTSTHRTPTFQPGVAGCSQNPSPSTHTHTAHPSQEWRGTSGAHTQAHTHPKTQAKSCRAQPKPGPKHTHPHCTSQPGMAGHSRKPSPRTHAHTTYPSQEWRCTSEACTQTRTGYNTPARSGGAQPKPEPKHTHPHRATPPGVARYKLSAHTSTHTPQHPSQEWQGAAETRAQAHTPTPHSRGRSGGAQPKPEPKHTRPHHTAQPGVAGYKPSGHTSTHRLQQPSQEWHGAAETRAQAHTPKPHSPARSVGAQPKPELKHTRPHHTPQPGVAGYKRSAHTNTHKPQHPSQEWRGAAETRVRAHTHTLHTPASNGGVQAGSAHTNTNTPTSQPGVAGRSQRPSPNTHMHTAHPSQEWRGTSGAGTQAHTHPNTPARSGGAQPEPEPKHTHPHCTAQPGVAVYKRSAHANTHTPQQPSQDWRGADENRTEAQPRPKHKRHTTVGNPVSIARALRQPVPCR